MNTILRLAVLRIASVAVGILPLTGTAATPAIPATTSADCTAAVYRQFDFWIGDWDTVEMDAPNGPSIARARIRPIVQGCALHELYEQNDGLIGDSILSYDPVRRQWQQTWVTNRGSLMVLVGDFRDGALVLEGKAHLKDGKTVMQRITWKRHGKGVRESAVLSRDGGKTWTPAFDVLFVKRGERRGKRVSGVPVESCWCSSRIRASRVGPIRRQVPMSTAAAARVAGRA